MRHFDVNLYTRALSALDELFRERPYDIVGFQPNGVRHEC